MESNLPVLTEEKGLCIDAASAAEKIFPTDDTDSHRFLKDNLCPSVESVGESGSLSRHSERSEESPLNFLIEGDNLAALRLLQKTHRGKIDVIYIDPPYNTGAKDWKYDNDYVDGGDLFRHSKWLSMMEKRLKIAKELLTERGVFICAIDDNELATITLLLKEIFGDEKEYHCITIVHNPNGTQGKNFSYCHEYAIFVLPKGEKIIKMQNRVDNPDIRPLRDVSKGDNMRTDAKNCFYPIFVKDSEIIGFGDVCPDDFHPGNINIKRDDGIIEVYPIDASGNERKWVFARQTVENIKDDLHAEYNKSRKAIDIIRHKTNFTYKTVWNWKELNANIFGTKILNKILPDCEFDFPKSLYNVMECINCIACPSSKNLCKSVKSVDNRKSPLILDFFAGSGTTGHAVLKLNAEDGGNRRFILCTNNENGICRDVTWQRLKTVMTGRRPDGSEYAEELGGRLKYFKIDFLPIGERLYYEYADELLSHIRELVELENGVDFSQGQAAICLTEDELDDFAAGLDENTSCRALYVGHDVLLEEEQERLFKSLGIAVNVVPEYYYKDIDG